MTPIIVTSLVVVFSASAVYLIRRSSRLRAERSKRYHEVWCDKRKADDLKASVLETQKAAAELLLKKMKEEMEKEKAAQQTKKQKYRSIDDQ